MSNDLQKLGFRVRKAISQGYQVKKDAETGKVDPLFQLEVGSPFPEQSHSLPSSQSTVKSQEDDDMMDTDVDVDMSLDDVPRAPSVFFSGAPIVAPDQTSANFTTIGFGTGDVAGNQKQGGQQVQQPQMKQTKLSDYFGQQQQAQK